MVQCDRYFRLSRRDPREPGGATPPGHPTPTTARRFALSDDGSSGTGGGRSRAAVRKAGSPGSGWTVSPRDGYRNPASFTPGPTSDSTPKPEGGAQCVSAHAGICAGGVGQPASLPRFPAGRGAVGAMEVVWPSGAALRGEASNRPRLHWLKTVVENVVGEGATRSRQVWVGEMSDGRESSAVDVSKSIKLMSKPGSASCSGISLGGTRLLPSRHPAYRQHDPTEALLWNV